MKNFFFISTLLVLSLPHLGYCSSNRLSLLYSFNAYQEGSPNSNSVTPDSGVTFYAHSDFNLFKVDAPSQTLTILQTARMDQKDESYYHFEDNIILSQDKQFIYGIENSFRHGAIFKLSSDGSYKQNLHEFDLDERFEEGYDAVGSLVLTKDEHKLYGVTESGGKIHTRSRGGVVYQINMDNPINPEYKILHIFSGKKDGNTPNGKLVLSPDERYLYGLTTYGSPPNYCGTLFRISLNARDNSHFETLRSFNCDSVQPRLNTLVMSKEGDVIYTSTTDGFGSILKIELNKPEFPLTVLHAFARNEQGQHPIHLVLNKDETTLYGISNGTNNKYFYYPANIFKLSLKGKPPYFSVLHRFENKEHNPQRPKNMILDDNILYGTSLYGGAYNGGTLFQYSLNSMLNHEQSECKL